MNQEQQGFIPEVAGEDDFLELLPGLPEELALECLTRLHYSTHGVASRVCKRWRHLLLSKDFYYYRKQTGFTQKAAVLIQSLSVQSDSSEKRSGCQPSYGLSVFEPVSRTWDWVDPVPSYPNGLPLFCQISSTEGKLIMMGGWDPLNWEPLKQVFVYEFTKRAWSRRADMPEARSFFAMCAHEGRVYVAGGHDESKNALKSAWVYDTDKDEWEELKAMEEERDECQGIIIGSEFWVVSGYDTESQGGFKNNADVYDLKRGEWRQVEGVWGANKCPRSCVGKGKDGNLICWAESDPAVKVGASGVDLGGELTLVTGSAYQGAPHGFFLAEGQSNKLRKIEVPDEFSGYVQSGCFVEV